MSAYIEIEGKTYSINIREVVGKYEKLKCIGCGKEFEAYYTSNNLPKLCGRDCAKVKKLNDDIARQRKKSKSWMKAWGIERRKVEELRAKYEELLK